MARVIQERVKKPLAEELLFGKLVKGGVVRVDVEDRAPVFTYTPGEGAKQGKSKPRKGGKSSKETRELVD